ncbi:hypothetical protein VFPPC_17528 [Pochonia chlamydosporia 170]|uniref:Uncharacterized protein n=1 Tax=Pochonia chlamydosporia 170 TaxID=1380566 RepID=A0A219ARU4_METCM|nr:hypothetical protein VFPPC_17528 [Pochonia chlamydosporia 170]OWT43309.1 hypothetical protein VFPPC_17528 [Pochonia chlamydosporia 170]
MSGVSDCRGLLCWELGMWNWHGVSQYERRSYSLYQSLPLPRAKYSTALQ